MTRIGKFSNPFFLVDVGEDGTPFSELAVYIPSNLAWVLQQQEAAAGGTQQRHFNISIHASMPSRLRGREAVHRSRMNIAFTYGVHAHIHRYNHGTGSGRRAAGGDDDDDDGALWESGISWASI
jgi:hypothetical protein